MIVAAVEANWQKGKNLKDIGSWEYSLQCLAWSKYGETSDERELLVDSILGETLLLRACVFNIVTVYQILLYRSTVIEAGIKNEV